MSTHDVGDEGEDLAAAYLANEGFQIIERKYRHGHGDIDIIAREGDCTVFVEVKMRTNNRFGPAIVAIPPAKQQQVARMARFYIWEHQLDTIECRFDAVCIDIIKGKTVFTHIRDAFRAG